MACAPPPPPAPPAAAPRPPPPPPARPAPPRPLAAPPARPFCSASHVEDSVGMRNVAICSTVVTCPLGSDMMPTELRFVAWAGCPPAGAPRPRPALRRQRARWRFVSLRGGANREDQELPVRRELRVRPARLLEFLAGTHVAHDQLRGPRPATSAACANHWPSSDSRARRWSSNSRRRHTPSGCFAALLRADRPGGPRQRRPQQGRRRTSRREWNGLSWEHLNTTGEDGIDDENDENDENDERRRARPPTPEARGNTAGSPASPTGKAGYYGPTWAGCKGRSGGAGRRGGGRRRGIEAAAQARPRRGTGDRAGARRPVRTTRSPMWPA